METNKQMNVNNKQLIYALMITGRRKAGISEFITNFNDM